MWIPLSRKTKGRMWIPLSRKTKGRMWIPLSRKTKGRMWIPLSRKTKVECGYLSHVKLTHKEVSHSTYISHI